MHLQQPTTQQLESNGAAGVFDATVAAVATTIDIDEHVISISATDIGMATGINADGDTTDVPWDQSYNITSTARDDDSVGVLSSTTLGAEGVLIDYVNLAAGFGLLGDNFAGIGVTDNGDGITANVTDAFTATGNGTVGVHSINMTSTGKVSIYDATVAPVTTTVDIDRHDTTLTITNTEDKAVDNEGATNYDGLIRTMPFDGPFLVETQILDDDHVGTTGSMNGKEIVYSGNALGATSATTSLTIGTTSGANSTVILTTAEFGNVSPNGTANKNVTATFEDTDPDYVFDLDIDFIEIIKHRTLIIVPTIPAPTSGEAFLLDGQVIDRDRSAITDSLTGSGDLFGLLINITDTTGTLPSATLTEGVTFTSTSGMMNIVECVASGLDTDPCNTNGSKLLRLTENDTISLSQNGNATFDVDPTRARFEMEELLFGQNVTWIGSNEDGNFPQPDGDSVEGSAPLIPGVNMYSGIAGVDQVRVEDIDAGENVSISAVQIIDPGTNDIISEMDFSEFAEGPVVTPFIQEDGVFFATGVAPINVTTSTISVTFTANGNTDPNYFRSNDEIETVQFVTIFNTFTASGVGGTSATLNDVGALFVADACGSLDNDEDALCNPWENNGVQYGVPQGLTGRFFLDSPNVNVKQIYVEIDYMEGHTPRSGALTDVKSAFRDFNNDEVDIVVKFELSDEIPHVEQINFWGDKDWKFSNSFNEIKNRWFGDTDINSLLTLSGPAMSGETIYQDSPSCIQC
jgi:hypothetical protein